MMRDIPRGAECTIDYAMIDGDPSERMECACGAPGCRGVVTGSDWRIADLQRRYAGYFSAYLQARIDVSRGAQHRFSRYGFHINIPDPTILAKT